MIGRGEEVDNPLVPLVSAGSHFDNDNALYDIDDLSMKTQENTRLKICMKTSLRSVDPLWKSPSYLLGNEMILQVYKIR